MFLQTLCISFSKVSSDISLTGSVYVDGQEMSMKLPEIKKGSVVAFQAESLPNGKVRISVQTEDKEVTFDWKVDIAGGGEGIGMLGLAATTGDSKKNSLGFYFGIKFSQEDWKIAVD